MIRNMCFSVEVQKELKKIAQRFNAQVYVEDMVYFLTHKNRAEDRDWIKQSLNLARKPTANIFKGPDEDNRIYPGSFTHVMVMENNKRVLKPMRYRVRPKGSKEEIPTKFN